MNWKVWPYWVRGLLIGLAAGILIDLYFSWNWREFFFEYAQCSILGPEGGECPKYFAPALMYHYLVPPPTLMTISGIILGYLYGKIKNRKSLSSNQ